MIHGLDDSHVSNLPNKTRKTLCGEFNPQLYVSGIEDVSEISCPKCQNLILQSIQTWKQ